MLPNPDSRYRRSTEGLPVFRPPAQVGGLLCGLLVVGLSACGAEASATDRVLLVAGIVLGIGALGTIVSIFRTDRQIRGPSSDGPRADRISCLEAFEKLRTLDAHFSVCLFEDFLAGLYLEAHALRGGERLETLDMHLSAGVRAELAGRAPPGTEVSDLQLGGLRYLSFEGLFDPEAERVEVTVELISFGHERIPRRPDREVYVRERWTLARAKSARSRGPAQIGVRGCPACHAPREAGTRGQCTHCGEPVDTGELDWLVTEVELVKQARKPPPPSLSDRPTSLLTMRQPDLEAREGQVDLPGLREEVRGLLAAFQQAWTEDDLTGLRQRLSITALQSATYWLDALRRRKEAFPLGDMELQGIELAATTQDRWYQSATLRVYAKVPRGRLDERRSLFSSAPAAYSAYWTFIRGRFPGPPPKDACPWCGAALEIVMEAVCEHCGAVVDKRAFGWLLSRIESVPAYHGSWSIADRQADLKEEE